LPFSTADVKKYARNWSKKGKKTRFSVKILQEMAEKIKKNASGGEKSLVHNNEKMRGEKKRPRPIPYSLTMESPFHTSPQDRSGGNIFFTSLTRTTMQIGFKKKHDKFCFRFKLFGFLHT